MEIKWELITILIGDDKSLGAVGSQFATKANKNVSLFRTIRSTTLAKYKDPERALLLYNKLKALSIDLNGVGVLSVTSSTGLCYESMARSIPTVKMTYTREPIKTFRFCGMDLDDDLNVIYKDGDLNIWCGNIFERLEDDFNSNKVSTFSRGRMNKDTDMGLTKENFKNIIRSIKFGALGRTLDLQMDVKDILNVNKNVTTLSYDYSSIVNRVKEALYDDIEEIEKPGGSGKPVIFQILDVGQKKGVKTWAESMGNFEEFQLQVGGLFIGAVKAATNEFNMIAKNCGILKIYLELMGMVYSDKEVIEAFGRMAISSDTSDMKINNKSIKQLDYALVTSFKSCEDDFVLKDEVGEFYDMMWDNLTTVRKKFDYDDIKNRKSAGGDINTRVVRGSEYFFASETMKGVTFDLGMLEKDSDLMKEFLGIKKYNFASGRAYADLSLNDIKRFTDGKYLRRNVIMESLKRNDEELLCDGNSDINDVVKNYAYKCSNDIAGGSHIDLNRIQIMIEESKEKDLRDGKYDKNKNRNTVFADTSRLIEKILKSVIEKFA